MLYTTHITVQAALPGKRSMSRSLSAENWKLVRDCVVITSLVMKADGQAAAKEV